ncbi:DNA-directed RNA polymerase I subunit RPA1-like [Physella acuta]|uniref:DNA-directed RNA polymerase I subunit RPA1-like n=1 Tax=Physella acuta TaxID=109671 RepID=UPI0027DD9F11|nr:DNA-directed RNA polymerase I subunit RPA1-like [Physella acuta]XP_059155056.1 DNA-directed RNA polymerase I subunit RPA1-like [Physella acuta]
MEDFHTVLNYADFRIYSKDEILQLSVKEIVNPQTFDILQNPVIGGLYDPALGPCRQNDRCETCGQSEKNCPGHFGHIKLPVLLFNPMLFKVLLQLLKGCCMSCHQIKLSAIHVQLYTYQLELLEKGFLAQAQDLNDRYFNTEQAEIVVLPEMSNIFQEILAGTDKDERVVSKNVKTQMQNTVRAILKTLASSKTTCIHCHTRNRTLKQEYNRTIVGALIEEKHSKRKSKSTKSKKGETEVVEDVDMDENAKKADEDKEAPPEDLQTEMDDFIKSKHKRCILSPTVAKDHLQRVWELNKTFLKRLFPFLGNVKGAEVPTDVFFLDTLPVPPSRFRPLSVMKERKYEHPQTANLSAVLKECVTLKDLLQTYTKGSTVPDTMTTHVQKLMASWLRLQSKVNVVLDSELDKLSEEKCPGVKQILEKKAGLFRMHMMGKRVNYAARSVISPDPYISTNEIGVPIVFASKLTYPQRVTPWNVHQLRQMVINGPNQYPGAVSVINEDGTIVKLHPTNSGQREAIAKQLLVPDKQTDGSKMVCRHLINGDYMILNRQPTLHRPSMQAHKARVLPNIKTLRMHYSNCKAYNADFDGDEMNAHFPQCELSRAEASVLALTDHQYLVPKDSTPLAGLIQDHMIAGVALTIRGKFFSRQDYWSLVWSSMNDWSKKMKLLPPSIIKPQPLWSGKQIISTILLNIIPEGKGAINLKGKAKISEKSWIRSEPNGYKLPMNLPPFDSELLGESTVVIRQGELLQGVLDKAHYGPSSYGLVHCCYELYGGDVAGQLLTYLARLFTSYLQMVGFSLGVGDILVQKKANKKRTHLIKKSQHVGKDAVLKALGMNSENNELELLTELKRAHFEKDGLKMAEVDMCMKTETDRIQDSISKFIMAGRLEKQFPENSLQLMVQSGAKGSPVNCMQISCLLGQIELEGRRPPLMLSGRSLPSFQPYDVSPKAGGFVTGRFLTGIRPQEYFFHCMAGREGLIDTAVKTSRSGYLQRCLVKHLEGLMVNYDLTVRDSDGDLVQFYYGEDGLEPIRSPFLKPALFPFLTENLHVLLNNSSNPWNSTSQRKEIQHTWKKIGKWRAKTKKLALWTYRNSQFLEFCQSEHAPSVSKKDKRKIIREGKFIGRSVAAQMLCQAWEQLDVEVKDSIADKEFCPDPLMARFFPHSQPDIMAEKFRHLLNVFCKKGFQQVVAQNSQIDNPDVFKLAINRKLIQSLAQPGEAVGLICAQSIGEPSTQMTLNTFHFAGRGEMNVTLGIPRLREILMTASANIKTPSMDVPVADIPDARNRAEKLRRYFNKVTLDQVLEYVKVKIYTNSQDHHLSNYKLFDVKFKFLPHRDYCEMTNLTPKMLVRYIAKHFLGMVDHGIKKENTVLEKAALLSSGRVRRGADEETETDKTNNKPDDEDDDDIVDNEPGDGDSTAVKEQQRHLDTQEYEGEEEEMKEVVTEENEEEEDDEEPNQANDSSDESGDESQAADTNTDLMSKENKELVTEALSRDFVHEFKLDDKRMRWCTVTFMYDQSRVQLDIRMLLEKCIKKAVLHQVKGITRAFLNEEKENGETVLHLKTEGVNMQELFKYPDVLDLRRIYSNCIHTMLNTYGIEAANRVIIKEIQNVFGAYGILVDYHHLSLLADYMTCRGFYDSFSRRDISYNTSPFQKMTFETTMAFLLEACVSGSPDSLKSPSGSLVVGNVVGIGTGCFQILDPVSKKES